MSESPHSAPKPRVDAASAGGDDRKGARRGAMFIGCVLIVYLVYLVVTGQFAEFVDALSTVQGSWIVVASVCMVFYIIFGVIAYAIAVWLDPESPVGIRDLISVEAAGTFFGNLTPMMVGGTPAQIYRLTKAGQPVGEAGATQFTRYIVFQVSLVLWAAILLAVRLPFFTSLYGDMTLLCLFSFGGHVILLAGLFVVSLCPAFVVRVAHWGIGLAERVSGENDRTRGWRTYVDTEVYSFSEHFKHAAVHLSSMGITLVVTMAQLACLYMVPYFVLRAFGNHDVDFISCLAAGAFIQLLSSAVPLPGGTGGAEGGFALFLGHFFGASATAGYLVWRLVTFFGPTIVCAPLLGLRSAHHASIHARWDRFVHRGKGPLPQPRAVHTAGTADAEAPAQPRAAEPVARASQRATAPARRRAPQIRQTPGGITVSPSSLKRRRSKR